LLIYLISLLFITLGALTHRYIARMRPNVMLGFRLPMSFVSKGVWKEANRVAGKAFMVTGAVFLILGGIFDEPLCMLLLGITVFVIVVVIALYVRLKLEVITGMEEGQGPPIRRVATLRMNMWLLLPPLLMVLASLLYLATNISALPSSVAIHFDLTGMPDAYMSREHFLIMIPSLIMILPLSSFITLLCSIGIPLSRFRSEQLLMTRIMLVTHWAISAILSLALIGTIHFNIHGVHLPHFFTSLFLLIIIYLIIITILFMNYAFRREKRTRQKAPRARTSSS